VGSASGKRGSSGASGAPWRRCLSAGGAGVACVMLCVRAGVPGLGLG
jgi:hypothetical protein